MGEIGRPLPKLGNDNEGFFRAAAKGELRLRACLDCGKVLHLPREYCKHCGSRNLEWRKMSGNGRLYSWTVVRHQVHPAFPTPYTVFFVELTDAPGVRLPSNAPGEFEVRAGVPMKVWFEKLTDELALPQFRLASEAEIASED